MEIRYRKGQNWQRANSIIERIGAADLKAPIISVIGAGGKTTTIRRMTEEFAQLKRKVIVTTTTHMRVEEDPCFLTIPSLDRLQELLHKYEKVYVGSPADDGKMKCVSPSFLKRVLAQELPLLIEADGAKGMPLKVPKEHEPVILPQTTHVLAVYGMDSIGKPLKEVCFRIDKAAELLKKGKAETVTPQDIAAIAASQRGGKKNCPPDAQYWVILNKAEGASRLEAAAQICQMLFEKGINNILVTGKGERGRR